MTTTPPPEGTTEPRSGHTVQQTAAYFADKVERIREEYVAGTRSVRHPIALSSVAAFLRRVASDDLSIFARPSPPVPAAEDDAVEKAAEFAYEWRGRDYDWDQADEAIRAHWRGRMAGALDAAGVSALRADAIRRADALRDALVEIARERTRAKAAEAEVERLTLLADDRDHDRRQARLREAEARQQVADLRAEVLDILSGPEIASVKFSRLAALAGSGEQPGEWRPCRCESHEEGCTKDRPAPVVPDSTGLHGVIREALSERGLFFKPASDPDVDALTAAVLAVVRSGEQGGEA